MPHSKGELLKHMNEWSRSGVAVKYLFRFGDSKLNPFSSLVTLPPNRRPKGEKKSRNSLYFGRGLKSASWQGGQFSDP